MVRGEEDIRVVEIALSIPGEDDDNAHSPTRRLAFTWAMASSSGTTLPAAIC